MKLIMIAHGKLASSMMESVSMILGPIENHVCAIDFETSDSFEHLSKKLEEQLEDEMNLVFCDLKGGTPFNTAFLLRKNYPIKIVCGMNLGMLLEYILLTLQADTLPALSVARDAGTKAIEIFDLE